MVDRQRAVTAAAEQLPENEQEKLAALWEETLTDNVRWRELFQHPGSQAFFAELRAETAQAEQENPLEDSPDEDWAEVQDHAELSARLSRAAHRYPGRCQESIQALESQSVPQ